MSVFQEIAFKAELDRHLDPECEYQAHIICEEDSTTRDLVVQELRNMIYERGECHPPRMDDAFLLRFLRARLFIPARAHRLVRYVALVTMTQLVNLELNYLSLQTIFISTKTDGAGVYLMQKVELQSLPKMVRYCTFREQNPHLWREVYWYGLTRLDNIFEGVLFDRPDVGRLIICRMGKWYPNEYPVEDFMRGCLLLLEIGIMQPKLQVLGSTVIVDCEGIGMKHARHLTPSVALQAINVMGFTFPINQRGVHIVNCSRFFEKIFYVFKRLAPSDEMWQRVHFHGYDYQSLHRYIDPECLPKRYGGYRETVTMKEWLTKIKKYKNNEFDEDLRTLGYAVDE